MKEIEITVKVFDSVEKTKDILARQGLKIIDTYSTKDIYLSQDTNLSQSIESVLNKSVILRQIVTPSKVIKKLSTKIRYMMATHFCMRIKSISNAKI